MAVLVQLFWAVAAEQEENAQDETFTVYIEERLRRDGSSHPLTIYQMKAIG
eukprot:IDg1316t1